MFYSNKKGAEQPLHPRSLISAFDVLSLESIIVSHATGQNISFLLIFVVMQEAGLSHTMPETAYAGFLRQKPIDTFRKFARVLFSRNFAHKFRENKPLAK